MALYKLGTFDFRFILRCFLTLIFASLGLIGILKILDIFILHYILKILFGVPLGALIFIGICKLLGPEETYMFFSKISRTFKNVKSDFLISIHSHFITILNYTTSEV